MSYLRRNAFRRNTTSTGVQDVNTSSTAGSDGTSADSSHRERAPIDDSDYARRSREIMEFYNSLENLGAGIFLENYFPEIVVIGGQSAGKSSLIEAVSKITVPRDSGTCTRCPMQCKLVSAPEGTPWTCTIGLRFLHDEGQNDDTPFVTLTSPQDVEIYLRRAQAAILCPARPKEFFLSKSNDELKRFAEEHKDDISSFSEDTIVVNIRGPNLTDLTFVDLPGLILKTADTEVAMLQDMVRRRIKSSKTIILTAIPMCEDMARQESKKISDDMDRNGERTIGVLTKPDTLSAGASGAREFWRKVLMGEKEPLKHGYFCVRLPDDDQRKQNISPSALTKQLLRDVAPWKDMSDKSRFGVDNLVSYMSHLLLALFEQSIPAMYDRVLVLIDKTENDLDALGPPPDLDNATTHVLLLVNAFYANLKNMIAGTCNKEHKTMIRTNRGYYGNMRHKILRTCPIFTVGGRAHSLTDPIMNQSQYRLTLEDVRKSIEENTAWVLPGEVPLEATRDLVEGFTKRWTRPTISCFDSVFENSRRRIIALAHSHFGGVRSLEEHVSSIINNEMTSRKTETLVIVKKVIELENRIYTVDPQFAIEKVAWLSRDRYHHNPSPSDSEFDVMAKVSAYFQVAHKRHIDTITATIENELHEPLPNQISKALIDSLSDGDRARELLTESPGKLAERVRLADRLARLTEIKDQLEAFGIPRRMSPIHEDIAPPASMPPSPSSSASIPLSRAPSVVSNY